MNICCKSFSDHILKQRTYTLYMSIYTSIKIVFTFHKLSYQVCTHFYQNISMTFPRCYNATPQPHSPKHFNIYQVYDNFQVKIYQFETKLKIFCHLTQDKYVLNYVRLTHDSRVHLVQRLAMNWTSWSIKFSFLLRMCINI